MQTALETKTDLGNLNRLYWGFHSQTYSRESWHQIDHKGVMVMTYKNGNLQRFTKYGRCVYIYLICFIICPTFISLKFNTIER